MAMRHKDYEYLVELLEMAKDSAESAQATDAVEFLKSALKFVEVQQTTRPPYGYPFTKVG